MVSIQESIKLTDIFLEKDTRIVDQMFERLANSLPSFMVYHSLAHTQYVIDRAVFLAKLQGCSAKELELVSIAGLLLLDRCQLIGN